MNTQSKTAPKEIFLKDYKEPTHWIKNIDLDIDIFNEQTYVTSVLVMEQNSNNLSSSFELDGIDLKLLEISVNDIKLTEDQYEVKTESLIVHCNLENFTLKTKVEIDPVNNHSCEGLYKSGDIFCTQNEAEGFRKITYYFDRPDVMAKFKTTVKADKKTFPRLLSNGNKVDSGELDNGRHFATWEDPFVKPCYLFAAVAGDLALVADTYTTGSGRKVDLEIFVDKGNEDKCDHAMRSLQNSMKWDEEVYGVEYDLDIYMVVAVDSFNMGAMENKGLNIFNSAYVLARPDTATDSDFEGIEGVIGHEYFHNWTGNRVTCRDWFQLTLKEGLTVFRDQEFSADMLSRPVKRIDDVQRLRVGQFPEDAGPMSHPILPKSYIEINNFYTATIYEKGAEVIRMIHTILGAKNFRLGMDLYFKRHDGQAVTTVDFVAAMSDASGVNLDQFKVWYDQNGTPKLSVMTQYNEDKKEFSLTLKQETKLNNTDFDALHIPFIFGLIKRDGSEFELENNGYLDFKQKEQTFVFKNITENPIPSFNRNYSCPVQLDYDYSDEELMYLMAHDSDTFNRYDAAQNLYKKEIFKLVELSKANKDLVVSANLLEAFGSLLNDKNIDEAFLAYAIGLPSENELNALLTIADYDNVHIARQLLINTIGSLFQEKLLSLYTILNQGTEYKLDAKSMGQRALRVKCLGYLASTQDESNQKLVEDHFYNATNMTDEIFSLNNIISYYKTESKKAIDTFHTKWKDETLVMQKWIAAQANISDLDIDDLLAIEKLDVYDAKNPNLIRSLVGVFASRNIYRFNKTDGSGFKFIADKIIEIDQFNPQVASRLGKAMNHKAKLDKVRKPLLIAELKRILTHKLSKDTFEVISKNLE